MTIYKGCPYCTAVFAIGPEEDEPLRRHIAHTHTATPDLVVVSEGDPDGHGEVGALRVRLAAGDRPTRDLTLALLAGQGVTVESLVEWFGLPPETVRERVDAVNRAMAARHRRPGGHGRRSAGVDDRGDRRTAERAQRRREPTAEQ
ncbi:hypothetical protein [Halomarina litorea]|uniref:hypothetical protein n=1 Tax=Halomarina litorea TaxID=2961595 RepID=UPI0020C4EBD3|nr:hypothetical protein [Halomarina sp. BCD28]